jgi:nitric oxide reductase NorD protein
VQTDSTTVDDDGPQRLALVASALAGRTVAVAAAEAGEPAWTDGITIFIDAAETQARQLESVTVQASLLAGGGLDADIVRKLRRRPGLARKYLAIEGHRALAANEDLLPYPVRPLIDFDLATRADTPAASLAAAGPIKVADPPASV